MEDGQRRGCRGHLRMVGPSREATRRDRLQRQARGERRRVLGSPPSHSPRSYPAYLCQALGRCLTPRLPWRLSGEGPVRCRPSLLYRLPRHQPRL